MTTRPFYHTPAFDEVEIPFAPDEVDAIKSAGLDATKIPVIVSPELQAAYDLFKSYGDTPSSARAAAERMYLDILNGKEPLQADVKTAHFGLYQWLPDISVSQGAPFQNSDLTALEHLLTMFADSLLLVIDDNPPHRCELYVDLGNGLWTKNIGIMGELMVRANRRWLMDYIGSGSYQYDNDSAKRRSEVIKWEADLHKASRRRAVLDPDNVALLRAHYDVVNWAPDGLTFAKQIELDATGRYIGVGQGVLDLDEKRILSPEDGRKKLISHSTGVDYLPDATDDRITAILDHLPLEHREWLLKAAGHALRGQPLHYYIIRGPSQSGKSTMLEVIAASLGEYAGDIPKKALEDRAYGGGTTEKYSFAKWARFAYTSDVSDNKDIDREFMNNVATADSINNRDLYVAQKDTRPFHSVATMFISVNPEREPQIDLTDDATLERIRVLSYPARAKADRVSEYKFMYDDLQAKQAMLAQLVNHSAATAPDNIQANDDALLDWRRSKIGSAAFDWIAENVIVTSNDNDRIHTGMIFDAAKTSEDSATPFGLTARELTNKVKQTLFLKDVDRPRIDGLKRNGWYGVRLAEEAHIEPDISAPIAEHADAIIATPTPDAAESLDYNQLRELVRKVSEIEIAQAGIKLSGQVPLIDGELDTQWMQDQIDAAQEVANGVSADKGLSPAARVVMDVGMSECTECHRVIKYSELIPEALSYILEHGYCQDAGPCNEAKARKVINE